MTLPDDNSREALTAQHREIPQALPPIRVDRRVPPNAVYLMHGEIIVGAIVNIAPEPPEKRSWLKRLIARCSALLPEKE